MNTIAHPATRPTPPAQPDPRPAPARVAELRARLLADAFLFEDPRGYRAGVEDALAGFESLMASR